MFCSFRMKVFRLSHPKHPVEFKTPHMARVVGLVVYALKKYDSLFSTNGNRAALPANARLSFLIFKNRASTRLR